MNVLITGASGGIGKVVTEYYASKGVSVFALDLTDCAFDSSLVTCFKVDITDLLALQKIANELKSKGVVLDAIVNIAGIFLIDSYIEVPENELKKIFDVNLFGTMYVNKIFYPLLKNFGKIIITTSEVAPLDPLPFNGIYNTTKTALDCYAQSLRQELNLLGNRVVTVRPGAFNTQLSKGSLVKTKELMDKTTLYKEQSFKFYNIVKMFMGKPSEPSKIAKLYYKALTTKRNKIIYKKHTNKLLKLMNLLPKRMQCFVVKSLLKPKVKK